jgi:hypothetical protein
VPHGGLSAVKKPHREQLCRESGAGSVYSKARRSASDSGLTQAGVAAIDCRVTEAARATTEKLRIPSVRKLRRENADIAKGLVSVAIGRTNPGRCASDRRLTYIRRSYCATEKLVADCSSSGSQSRQFQAIGRVHGLTLIVKDHGRAALWIVGRPQA